MDPSLETTIFVWKVPSNLSSALKTIFVDENNIGLENSIEFDIYQRYINEISKKS